MKKDFFYRLNVWFHPAFEFGHVLRSSINDSPDWVTVDSGLPGPEITSINTLSESEGTIFAGTNMGVYLSTNNGTSWTSANFGLADTDVRCLMVNGGNIYAGSFGGGVFISTNNGTSWTAVNAGLPLNSTVYSLTVSDGTLFAGTEGAGVWRRPLSEIVGVINHKPRIGMLEKGFLKLHSPNSSNPKLTVEFSLPHSDQVAIKIYNLTGREIASLVNKYLESGEHSMLWNTRNIAPGCYTVRMQTGSNTFVKSIPIFR